MDLTNFNLAEKSEEGAELTLVSPAGEELDAKIVLVGKDSPKYRNAFKKIIERKSVKKQKKIDLDLADRETVELVTACTISWQNIEEDGVVIEFNAENAKRIYTEHAWVREQADEFIGDRANFLAN